MKQNLEHIKNNLVDLENLQEALRKNPENNRELIVQIQLSLKRIKQKIVAIQKKLIH